MGLDTVELIHNIETHFNIKVPDAEWAQVHRINEIHDLILQYVEPGSWTPEQALRDLKGLVAESTGLKASEIKDTDSITNDLGLD